MQISTTFWTLLILNIVIIIMLLSNIAYKSFRTIFKSSRYSSMGESSKIRLVRQLNEAVEELSKTKTGAIITIINKDSIDGLRTDGIKMDANISSSLILSIFNKHSPLHDGAIIIDNNKITYAATYYKITSKSINNKYGARHRAAMGISEQTDALTIVISETTGAITFAEKSEFFVVKTNDFQEKLTESLK